MNSMKDFLPQYREINSIFTDAVNNGVVSYEQQTAVTEFYENNRDIKSFEKMILDVVMNVADTKSSLLLTNLQTEIMNNINLYESGKDTLDAIDIGSLCKIVSSRFDNEIKLQSDATAEYRRELNRVNGSLESIGFREHTKEEERQLEREHEHLTKLYQEEKAKLDALYDEKRKLECETAKYNKNLFREICELSQSYLSLLHNYLSSPSHEEREVVPIKDTEQKPSIEIKPDHVFRSKMFEKFRELEARLINDNYLDENLHWLPKHDNNKPDIKRLVTFMVGLDENKYFLPNKDRLVKSFFESRYHINIGQNFEPKRRAPLIEKYKVVFYDYPF